MVSNSNSGFSLPVEARPFIWRIFGNGESPLTSMTTGGLIEPVIRKHVSAPHQMQAIAEIHGWFESDGDPGRLKDGLRKEVATLILHGVSDALSAPNGFRGKRDSLLGCWFHRSRVRRLHYSLPLVCHGYQHFCPKCD